MTKRLALLVVILVASISLAFIVAPDFIETLKEKLWAYLQENPTTCLYVHTDKNIYSPTEKIWFKAYTLAGTVVDSKVLYVRLADDKKQVVAKAEFLMYDIRSHGDLPIPDTLKDGNYFFYAYTDRMLNFSEKDAFVQPIVIRRNKKRWQAEAYVIDSTHLKRGGNVEVLVRLKQDNEFVKDIKGKYQLLDGDKLIRQRGFATNNIGEAYMSFTYPDLADDHSLTANIVFENETNYEQIRLYLRHEGNQLKAEFYPEGGHFVEGVRNNMAIAVTDINHNAVCNNQVVFKNNQQVIDTATTNISGIADFTFVPLANDNYTVELNNYGTKQILPFKPVLEAHGYTINVVPTKDGNYQAIVTNKGVKEQYLLTVRSFDEVLWSKQLTIADKATQTIDIPVNTYEKQLLSFDILDANGNILAQRMMQTTQVNNYNVLIKTNSSSYGTRKRVNADITITDKEGRPVDANFSIAVVEKNTIDERLTKSITRSFEYRNTPLSDKYYTISSNDIEETNKLLLTQNWLSYEWANMLSFSPTGKLVMKKNADGICGIISCVNKKKKDFPKSLNILSNNGISEALVSDNGYFYIAARDLIIENNKTKVLVLNPDFYEKYDIKFMNYDDDYDKLIASSNKLNIPKPLNTLLRYKKIKLDSIPGIKRLEDIIVKSIVHNGISENEMAMLQSALCTSYVCINNILNCPNHKTGTPPIIGRTYSVNGKSVVYMGCYTETKQKNRIPLKQVSSPSEFILIDYDKEPSKEPEVRTTLYWNPNIYTDKIGSANISFFTNDIKSDFKIIVQGVTLTNVRPFQGSFGFSVK